MMMTKNNMRMVMMMIKIKMKMTMINVKKRMMIMWTERSEEAPLG